MLPRSQVCFCFQAQVITTILHFFWLFYYNIYFILFAVSISLCHACKIVIVMYFEHSMNLIQYVVCCETGSATNGHVSDCFVQYKWTLRNDHSYSYGNPPPNQCTMPGKTRRQDDQLCVEWYVNPFNASCSKLLLLEGFSTILVNPPFFNFWHLGALALTPEPISPS